jgi:hypothetical protein
MSYSIKDRLDFQMAIGGKSVELESNLIDFFHVVESVRLYVPMMTLRIKDINRFFTRNEVLVDGDTIVVSIGIQSKKIIYPFRLFSHKAIIENGVTSYLIHAYLDIPRYWTESTNEIVNDTSSSLLSQMCDVCSMTYDGVKTNDQQIWIPRNRRRAEFARYVVGRSYIDDQSCIQMGVQLDKTMKVRNVSDFTKFQIAQSFSNIGDQNQDVITDFNVINKAGFQNATSGYKDKQVRQSFLKDDDFTKDLEVRKNTRKLMLNSAFVKSLTQNRVTFSPIDVGNVSQSYEKAKYQNERLANFFATGVEFITPKLVTANLLDIITCDLSNPGAPSVKAMSGKYMLTSKVVYVENMNFYQKVECFRQGTNAIREDTQV